MLKQMLQAGAGEPLKTGARIGCMVNAPRVSLATITEADIIGEAKLAAMQPIRSRINTVIPRYRSEAHEWEVVPAAPIRVPLHITEDGDERSKEITYSLVQDADQAATMARYDIENTRELGPGTFPLLPKWINYKAGDCVTIARADLPPLKVLILRRTIEPSTPKVTFEVRSETDGKHAFALGQTTTPPPTASVAPYDPTVTAPAASDWTLTGTTLTANGVSIPALVLTGLVALATAEAAIFDLRPYVAAAGIDDNWIGAGIESPTINRKEFTGVTPGTQYEVSIRYRVRGVIGFRRILGPVTAGAFAVPGSGDNGTDLGPATDFIATLRPGTRTVDLSWRNPRSPRFNFARILANGQQKGSDMLGGLGVYMTSVITLTGSAGEFDIVIRSFDDAGAAVDTDPQTVSG